MQFRQVKLKIPLDDLRGHKEEGLFSLPPGRAGGKFHACDVERSAMGTYVAFKGTDLDRTSRVLG